MKINDLTLLAESYGQVYTRVNEADSTQPAQTQQPSQPTSVTRLKNISEFNTNLQAVDEMEDKIINFFDTAQKTGWLNAEEINAIKATLQGFVTGTLASLLISTEVKDAEQMNTMMKSIQSKIKFVDADKIIEAYNRARSGQQAATSQSAQPANYGAQPYGNFRFQQALDTIKNFQQAGVSVGR